MNERKEKEKMKIEILPRWVGLVALTSLMLLMVVNADFLIHRAWALDVTTINNVLNTSAIVRTGNQIWVSSQASDTIKVWSTYQVLLGSISATDINYLFKFGTRVYGYSAVASPVLQEYDPANIAGGVIRTSAVLTGCTATSSYTFDESGGRFFCSTGASNTIKIVALSTFLVTTSSTVNTGANACNVPAALAYDSGTDTLFAGCNTSDNIVGIVGVATSGTPDFGTSYTNNFGRISWDATNNKLWVTENTGSVLAKMSVVDTTSITLDQNLTHNVGTVDDYGTWYDAASDRLFVWGSADLLEIRDAGDNGSIITSISLTCTSGTDTCSVFAFSNIYVYATSGTSDFYEINLTGVGSGSGGPPTPASICYVDKNFDGIADYIFTDVGGPDGFPTTADPNAGVPDGMCDWSGFGTTSPPPITDTGGGLICLTGLIPCTNGQPTDPDPQTNGLGYLLVIFFLGIMIMFFGVASVKLNLGIPDWLWMIGTFAVIGFATLIGWIDQTLFIIGVVALAALASVSLIKRFGGGF